MTQNWEAFCTGWAVRAPSPTEEELGIVYSTDYHLLQQDRGDNKNLTTELKLVRTTSIRTVSECSSDSGSDTGSLLNLGVELALENKVVMDVQESDEALEA